MSFFDRFKRVRRGLFEPGETINASPRMRARVWEVFLELDRRGELLVRHERDLIVRLDDLPVKIGRYRIERVGDEAVRVDIIPSDDADFLGAHPAGISLGCGPLIPFDFRGIALSGPSQISYSGAMTGEGLFTDVTLPQFVVAGRYSFTGEQLMGLSDYPERAIHIVIENKTTGSRQRNDIRSLNDSYEHEAIGINRSPAPEPQWEVPREEIDEGMTIGGYFNIPMGLHVVEPSDSPYRLVVHAECDAFRSNTVVIEIKY